MLPGAGTCSGSFGFRALGGVRLLLAVGSGVAMREALNVKVGSKHPINARMQSFHR